MNKQVNNEILSHINNELNRLKIHAKNSDIFRARIRAKNILKLCDELLQFRVNDRQISESYRRAKDSMWNWEEEIEYKIRRNGNIFSNGYDSFAYYTRINIETFSIESYINTVKIVMDRPMVKIKYNGIEYMAHVVVCGFRDRYYVIEELDEWLFEGVEIV